MDTFTASISSKTLRPFDSHIDNMEVYGDDATFIRKLNNITPESGAEDGEIGVFRAEKYFNGGMDLEGSQKSTNNTKPSNHHMMIYEPMKPKPWVGTPSVGSESSSINSQRPLLKMVGNSNTTTITPPAVKTTTTTTITKNNDDYCSSVGKNSSGNVQENTSTTQKSFLSTTLGYCKCYSCKDKDSVDVNEDVGEISFSNTVTKPPNKITATSGLKLEDQVSSESSFRENHFSFPAGSLKKVVHFEEEEEVERKSLDVFGSPVMGRLRISKPISLEKRLAMLSWDLTDNNIDDEINSDCSSDLFEIESLTKQTTTNHFQSPTASSSYAPSEASVEWSVATASALDFEERRPSTTTRSSPPPKLVHVNKLEVVVQKRRPSSLLGCKSQKAVTVAEDHNSSKSGHQLIERGRKSESSSVPMKIRVQDETKVGGFSFRSQGLPTTYSPRLSNISFNV